MNDRMPPRRVRIAAAALMAIPIVLTCILALFAAWR
jgi:hypothetical protein